MWVDEGRLEQFDITAQFVREVEGTGFDLVHHSVQVRRQFIPRVSQFVQFSKGVNHPLSGNLKGVGLNPSLASFLLFENGLEGDRPAQYHAFVFSRAPTGHP